MDKAPYEVGGYGFQSKEEYERALKEKETVSYLMANTDTTDAKAMLKIYNRSIEKGSFRTVVGLEFMSNLRKSIAASGTVSAESLAPIPAPSGSAKAGVGGDGQQQRANEHLTRQVKHYKEAYENAKTGSIIKNMAIVILLVIVIGMLIFTYKSQYSIFTYFTNYKEKMREDLLDEFEEWQNNLEEKEKELNQREQFLDGQQ